MKNKAVILINVGTPDSPNVGDVRKYLMEFLGDGRVIDLPWLFRKILVNIIISPIRSFKSSKLYQRLWTENGSPLLYLTKNLSAKLQVELGDDYDVYYAMRYQKPHLLSVLDKLDYLKYDKILFIPMFPHYASSTSGTVIEFIYKYMAKKNVVPQFKIMEQFYNTNEFIDSFSQIIATYNPNSYDAIIMTYHSLPLSHLDAVHPKVNHKDCSCINEMPEHGKMCYRATCYQTTRLLIKSCNLDINKVFTSFQSRLTKNWITPFTDELLIELAKQGKKKVLLVAPSFTTDCLETIIELGYEYKHLFEEAGGLELTMVRSLNDEDIWVKNLTTLIIANNQDR